MNLDTSSGCGVEYFGCEFGISSCFIGHGLFFAAQLWLINKGCQSTFFSTAGTISNLYTCIYTLRNDFRMMFWLLFHFSTEEINLDSSSPSPLTPELHHADSVVVLSGPDLCVRLPLAVLPAQLASFRQKRAKGDGTGPAKKTQKRKGQTVSQNDSATQDRGVVPALSSANDTELNNKTNHEVHSWSHRDYLSCFSNWVTEETEDIWFLWKSM